MKKALIIIVILLALVLAHFWRSYNYAHNMLGAHWGVYQEYSDVNFLTEDFNSDKWNHLKVQANTTYPDLLDMQDQFKRCFWDKIKLGDCMPGEY